MMISRFLLFVLAHAAFVGSAISIGLLDKQPGQILAATLQ